MDNERDYWNYIHSCGDPEEIEKAADYFNVSPSAFEETYDDFFGNEHDI